MKNGFTLIEALIIIAIIGILAAVAIPQITRYQNEKQGIVPELESELIGTLDDCKVYRVRPPYGGKPFYRQSCPNGVSELTGDLK